MRERVTRRGLRHDRQYGVFADRSHSFFPKYRGKVLEGEVAEAARKLSGKTAKNWILRL